jgi:hypothetical protein
MPTFKWLLLNNLRFKTLGQIQNLDPHRLVSRLKSKSTPGDTLRIRHTPIDVWSPKMDIDGDGGRREFGLRGQATEQKVISEPPQIRSPDIKEPEGGQPFTYDLLLL